ncbi:MAG: hypothetical protein QM713_10890 [Arachnia sp.]
MGQEHSLGGAAPLPYLEGKANDKTWTVTANALMNEGLLAVTYEGKDLVATGQCPRCGHDVGYRRPARIILTDQLDPTVNVLRPGGPTWVQESVLCWCDDEHPGRGDNVQGCGAIFLASIQTARP